MSTPKLALRSIHVFIRPCHEHPHVSQNQVCLASAWAMVASSAFIGGSAATVLGVGIAPGKQTLAHSHPN